jgi:hypothetical protein
LLSSGKSGHAPHEVARIREWRSSPGTAAIQKKAKKGVVLNPHYSQPAHQQIAAALTDREQPWVESVFAEDRDQDGLTSILQWIGVEDLDWAFIEKYRV